MDLTLPTLAALVRETLRDPRGTARRLMALDLPPQASWLGAAVIAALSAILAHLTFGVMAARQGGPANLPAPVMTAAFQYAVMVMTVLGVYHIGRRFGGRGGFADALLLVVWLQFILVCVQGAQLVALLVLPPVADILSVAGLVLFLWLLTAFVAELHGFSSMGRVLGGVIASLFGLALVMAIFLSVILGGPPGGR
ncbi:MAG: YIP1 family protein [Gemmobacter sp.]